MVIDKRLLRDLARVYGSMAGAVTSRITVPPSRLYIRVNVLRIEPGVLLDRLRERGVEAYRDPYVPEALFFPIRRMASELEMLDSYIVVDRYAAESIMLGATIYAPGVVEAKNFRRGDTVAIIAPNGRVIAHAEALVDASMARVMRRGPVAVNTRPLYRAPAIRDMPEYEEGLFYPQSIASMLAAHLLEPEPGETVIDMNAAPGGKTSHFIEYSGGAARVIAFERGWRKAMRVAETIRRLRHPWPVIIVGDSRYADNVLAYADKVLIDPPCTGLGVRPKIDVRTRYRDAVVLMRYQRQFLEAAARYMPRGALLLYSTCTLTLIENEENTLYAVENLGFEPVEAPERPPYTVKVYYGDIVAYRMDVLGHDTPGHYYALMVKK